MWGNLINSNGDGLGEVDLQDVLGIGDVLDTIKVWVNNLKCSCVITNLAQGAVENALFTFIIARCKAIQVIIRDILSLIRWNLHNLKTVDA